MMESFEDYYKFLEIDPSSDRSDIQIALDRAQKKIEEARLYPDLHRWAMLAKRMAEGAAEHLLEPSKRQAYDAQRAQYHAQLRVSVATFDAQILWLDPPYIFYTDDPDPATTVPALARKLDTDWTRAIEEINDQGIELMLRHVGRRTSNLQPYERLRQQISRLRESLGTLHQRQMLESVIVLCDETIERPRAQLVGQAPDDFSVKPVARRPDQTAVLTCQLEHGGPRGVVFGYLWLEEPWAQITMPSLEYLSVDGQRLRAARFEIVGAEKQDIAVSIQPAELMKLSRSARHTLTVKLCLQPDTAHETHAEVKLSVDVTLIPARAEFTPPVLTLPPVRRGQPVSGTSSLVNKGEQPLNARYSNVSDQSVAVTPTVLPSGGQIEVSIDTHDLREGSRYQKWARFRADGDVPELTLVVEGELLPNAVQHFFRQRTASERFQLAMGGGLAGMGLSLVTFLASLGVFFWFFWIQIAAFLTAKVAGSVARRVIKHRQAGGKAPITLDSFAWSRLYLGIGGLTTVFLLILAFLPLDLGSKTLICLPFFALVGACWGFFWEKDDQTKAKE